MNRKDTQMYLWLRGKGKNQKEWIKIVSIDVEDAIKMVDDGISYELSGQTQYIIPKTVYDFDKYISDFMRKVFGATLLVSKEEYLQFCLSRLERYEHRKKQKKYLCEQFFGRYFPIAIQEKYNSIWRMIEAYSELIEKEVSPTWVVRGGNFMGCYVDDWGRKRPITEPKRLEKRYDFIKQLKICLREGIMYE